MRRTLAGIGCLLALAACGARPAADVATTPSPARTNAVPSGAPSSPAAATADARPTAPATATPAGDMSTEPATSPDFPEGGDGIAYLVRVEAGRHDGFDRVVWEFDGPAPSYRVEYVTGPVAEQGSGQPVEVDGAAALQVIFSLASGVDLSGTEPQTIYDGPDRLSGVDAGTVNVAEVVQTGDFEATLSWAVGVDEITPFTVRRLEDPTRVAVDIAH